MTEIIIIAAVSKNGIIGNNGKLPWHSEADLTHFKNLTMGFPVIMGRKTYQSIGKVLPGRLNIVLSRKMNLELNEDELKICSSLKDALNFCQKEGYKKIFIIGGAEIYTESIKIADKLIISEMKFYAEGNVHFPEIDKDVWKFESEEEKEDFNLKIYKRVNE